MPSLTFDEYLAQENPQETRHEYVAGHIFSMPEISAEHYLLVGRIENLFNTHLGQSNYQFYSFYQKVWMEEIQVCYYPDILVVNSTQDSENKFTTNPILIIEIFSPGTLSTDRKEKLLNYQKIPTLQEYILFSESEAKIEIYRKNASNIWDVELLQEQDQLNINSLNLTIPVAEIYEEAFTD